MWKSNGLRWAKGSICYFTYIRFKIIEPEKDVLMERPHRFVSLLPTCTHFVADIHELDEDDRERIRIKVIRTA